MPFDKYDTFADELLEEEKKKTKRTSLVFTLVGLIMALTIYGLVEDTVKEKLKNNEFLCDEEEDVMLKASFNRYIGNTKLATTTIQKHLQDTATFKGTNIHLCGIAYEFTSGDGSDYYLCENGELYKEPITCNFLRQD